MHNEDVAAVVLEAAAAEHTELQVLGQSEGATRFANNAITQNVSKRAVTATVRSAFGQCVGSASTTVLTPQSLREVTARAEAIARSSSPDLEYLPPPGPQTYPEVHCHDPATAAVPPDVRADGVGVAARLHAEKGAECSGSYTTGEWRYFTANSSGLVAERALTHARFTTSSSAGAGTGWSEGYSHRNADLDIESLARVSRDKATSFGELREVESGPYTVVLEPAAFAALLGWVAWTISAKDADEEHSPWQGRAGTRVASELLTLRSDPSHPLIPGWPFSEDDLPARAVPWIRDGVLENLYYGRFWAHKMGREFTGWPMNLIVDGGDASVDDLIRGVSRGVLITRFWYMNIVDEMALSLTGMTRGGLFLIENGEVTAALRNMRFNDSPLSFLDRIVTLGRQELTYGEFEEAMVAPSCVLDGFHFTSGTSF
jgi:predicted Zn-dependent protease